MYTVSVNRRIFSIALYAAILLLLLGGAYYCLIQLIFSQKIFHVLIGFLFTAALLIGIPIWIKLTIDAFSMVGVSISNSTLAIVRRGKVSTYAAADVSYLLQGRMIKIQVCGHKADYINTDLFPNAKTLVSAVSKLGFA